MLTHQLTIATHSHAVLVEPACRNPECQCQRCQAQRKATAERLERLLDELAQVDATEHLEVRRAS